MMKRRAILSIAAVAMAMCMVTAACGSGGTDSERNAGQETAESSQDAANTEEGSGVADFAGTEDTAGADAADVEDAVGADTVDTEGNVGTADSADAVDTEAIMIEDTEITYEVIVEELSIPNGENTIYGKVYKPDTEGQHPAIILCHGYNGSNNDFVSECRLYAENGYVACAFDFCGGSASSKSTGETSDMTIFTEESDLIAVFHYIAELDVVDESQIVLFGGSQGGLVASLAAEELADQVIALALYFPAYCIPDNWRTNYPTLDNVPETIDFWGMTLGQEFVVSIHDFYTFDEIGDFDKEVLILHGDQDAIVPLSYSEQAVELYENAELVVMEGEGHGFTPTAGKTAREKVLSFLDSVTE